MPDYIERDAAINAVFEAMADGRAVFPALNNLPAADVRPVVLCRDCKYWFNAPVADGFNSCERDALIRHEDFFCAAGEKREES